MEVILTHVGTENRDQQVRWPGDWPIPPVGADVRIPGLPEVVSVRTVVWYPEGGDDMPHDYPHVYIVVGPARPEWTQS